jgi:cation/acetate symporter
MIDLGIHAIGINTIDMNGLFVAATSTVSGTIPIIAVVIAIVATIGVGSLGMRIARTTSDFFVASRSVGTLTNASAICGEYLSAASFLGIAGLIVKYGVDMEWYPVGYTAGYLMLLLFVAAPLRRFGAYTIPDFAEGRFDSLLVRRIATLLVLCISSFYLVPQMKGAGITMATLTGAPYWVGVVVVGAVVSCNVAMGGMRGVTFVQAFQYWLKFAAIAVPGLILGGRFLWHRPAFANHSAKYWDAWSTPVASIGQLRPHPMYATYSLIIASFLGTMGLPHILVRFYTSENGRASRRTTLWVIGLLGSFYIFPLIFGALGRAYAPDLVKSGATDTVVLLLPQRLFGGLGGELLGGLVACGAFAAFLSTASGLVISVAGAISQDILSGSTRDFRKGALIAGVVAIALGLQVRKYDINQLVSWIFAIAASSFCPLLLLGIWWRRLSVKGAIAGLLSGAIGALIGVVATMANLVKTGWPATLASQPAAWSVPLAFTVMIVVSLFTQSSVPEGVQEKMLTFHMPESLGLAQTFRS